MTRLELLAPAKDLACGKAAIDHGADAVYIGAYKFGARQSAGNSIEDIRELCEYAHRFDAKVYATVNTIVKDDELEPTAQLLSELDDAHVDAILVQDMAIVELSKRLGLRCALHASTQTDNRTAEKVEWLRNVGFKRAVLARELSIAEIAEIHSKVPDMPLEIFVHGALCVGYSGICYASQHCFQRSANRGACAQFCRLRFDLIDSSESIIVRNSYLLSLKDMWQINNLEDLVRAGATSFKIEGRLKGISYVKNVTAAYSQKLNELAARYPEEFCRASKGKVTYAFTPNLKRTFNRGYTTYFAWGRLSKLASFISPKSLGEYVGSVKELRRNSFNVAGTATFVNGDGLCFINRQGDLEGFRVNRVENNRIFPLKMPQGLCSGTQLYRNYNQAFEHLLSKPSAERLIPIRLSFGVNDEGFVLRCGDVEVSCKADLQYAQKPQRENIVRQLSKLGGTSYCCSSVEIAEGFPYFVPSSVLSSMRRELVERMEKNGKMSAAADDSEAKKEKPSAIVPTAYYSRFPYLYNVANTLSSEFYSFWGMKQGCVSSFGMNSTPSPLLMQCRYCLRHELGFCVRRGGEQPKWKEPLFLRLPDGRKFRLQFDCNNCQMNVYAAE